ncbi:IS4 family transposase [Propionivibrio sp.]|uniref:IS4 family transposase n=1 Tax=Propionivibrio sp. TaxID=2212460 RepID=UPI003BF3056B
MSRRLARLVRLGRTHTELEATAFFTAAEWKEAYIAGQETNPEITAYVARIDQANRRTRGFLSRKIDGDPGIKTLWLRNTLEITRRNKLYFT